MENDISKLCNIIMGRMMDNPHTKATWSQKFKYVKDHGHHIVCRGGLINAIYEYEEFKFKAGDKEDQLLAKTMINLDYDIDMLKEREKAQEK